MTPESVRREILLLASGAWAGPWQVLLRVRELDPTLSEAEVETMVQVALEGLAQRGCLWFLRRNPAGVHVTSHSMLSSSEVHAALSDTGWRVAPPLDDLSFGLTPVGERALARPPSRRVRKELAKVVAGVAAAVRGLIRRRPIPSRVRWTKPLGSAGGRPDRLGQWIADRLEPAVRRRW